MSFQIIITDVLGTSESVNFWWWWWWWYNRIDVQKLNRFYAPFQHTRLIPGWARNLHSVGKYRSDDRMCRAWQSHVHAYSLKWQGFCWWNEAFVISLWILPVFLIYKIRTYEKPNTIEVGHHFEHIRPKLPQVQHRISYNNKWRQNISFLAVDIKGSIRSSLSAEELKINKMG